MKKTFLKILAVALIGVMTFWYEIPLAFAAIGFSSVITNSTAGSPTATYSVTVSAGTDKLLVVGVSTFDPTLTNRTIASVTFNGTALTKINESDNTTSSGNASLWYLLNPAVVTGNVVITSSGSNITGVDSYAAQFTGVSPTGQPNTQGAGATVAQTTHSVSVTPTVDSTLVVDALNGNTGPFTKNASQTSLMNVSGGTGEGSYLVTTAAGTYAMSYTTGVNDDGAHAVAVFKPTVTVTPADTVTIQSGTVRIQSGTFIIQ
jgi:hypothetical protein